MPVRRKPAAPCPLDISVIVGDMEAVGDGHTIVDLSRKGSRRVSLVIRQILRQSIVTLEVEPVATYRWVAFQLERLVIVPHPR